MKKFVYILLLPLVVLCSCDKGYQVRFSNYYLEKMDSVIIGQNTVVFTGIPIETTTPFTKIKKGKYGVTLITASKKHFNSEITIPKSGSGNRTIQIDGVNLISIIEE